MKSKSAFHVSNLGVYGRSLPRDLDGFCYTTTAGWLRARVDTAGVPASRAEKKQWARDQAFKSQKALQAAEAVIELDRRTGRSQVSAYNSAQNLPWSRSKLLKDMDEQLLRASASFFFE